MLCVVFERAIVVLNKFHDGCLEFYFCLPMHIFTLPSKQHSSYDYINVLTAREVHLLLTLNTGRLFVDFQPTKEV